jgi:hypothetical protein
MILNEIPRMQVRQNQIAGSLLAEAVGFFRAKKILSMPSFGSEVKPCAPCRRFAACQRTL